MGKRIRLEGCIFNRLRSGQPQPEPKVGDGVTRLMYSDRRAYTVLEVKRGGKTIVLQEDKVTRTDKNGPSEHQEYTFAPDPKGEIITLTLSKNGWGQKSERGNWLIGVRERYYDYTC